MKKLTIVEIARMAGVGTTTVSRYFNGGNLKKDTKEKIKEVVESLKSGKATVAPEADKVTDKANIEGEL